MMKFFKLNKKSASLSQGSVLSIGNFDGVHHGHQALLQKLLNQSKDLSLPSVVILFEPHPKEFFLKKTAPKRIYTLREKIFYIKALGIDYVACIDFNHSFANLNARYFVQSILHEKLHAKYILIGHDFQFGKNREGHFNLLATLGHHYGFTVHEFPVYQKEGKRVSSTQIRQHLETLDLDTLSRLLGRPYSMIGRVIYGRQLASSWGFPTANIALFPQKLSLNGVFCVKISICGQNQEFNGVANMGYRPTLDGQKPFLEVFIFDFNDCLYGQFLKVTFCHQLRNEQKFADIEQLKQQIKHDVLNAKNYFITNS